MTPELQPLPGREPAALAEFQAEVVAVLRDAINLLCQAEALGFHPAQLAAAGLAYLLGHLARLLIEPGFGNLDGARGCLFELLDFFLRLI